MRFLQHFSRAQAEVTEVPVGEVDPTVSEKATKEAGTTDEQRKDSQSDADSEEISKDAQEGVQRIEAITKVWSRWHLVVAYLL